ncbi:Intraflagellar transport protein 80 [Marasmius tenuissimus]|uniref:Intraflagellar transport protein 80 n=1 Tax=Marasmius tenuissimus TaxID=585030 RepID=A0ABR3A7I0_9AGAR
MSLQNSAQAVTSLAEIHSLLRKQDELNISDRLESKLQEAYADQARLDADLEAMKRRMKCYYCDELLTSPHVLQCSHAFCSGCLNQIRDKHRTKCFKIYEHLRERHFPPPPCPQCDRPIFLPPIASPELEAICDSLATQAGITRRTPVPLTWPELGAELEQQSESRYIEDFLVRKRSV